MKIHTRAKKGVLFVIIFQKVATFVTQSANVLKRYIKTIKNSYKNGKNRKTLEAYVGVGGRDWC